MGTEDVKVTAMNMYKYSFEVQEKSFSLELANLILSQETKTLSSGKISVRGVLIQVRFFFSRTTETILDRRMHEKLTSIC